MKLPKTVMAALAAVAALNLPASEKQQLDSYVKCGILTPSEASQISRSMANVVPKREDTRKLRLSSRMQLQYEWTDSSLVSGRGTNSNSGASSFLARRIFIQADADLGGGWTAQFGLDLARTQANCFLIDNYVAKSIEGEYIDGTLYLGYMKPQFIYEEVISSFELSAIERSPATMFWSGAASSTRMGVGNRYAGVRWNGNVRQIPGLAYILSVTNSYQLSPTDGRSPSTKLIDNSLAYWFSASYTMKGKEEPWKIKIGAYSMYSSSANRDNNSAIYSINPYVAGNWGNFNFWAEYIGSVVADGRVSAAGNREQCSPYGINFCVEYLFDTEEYGKIGPVFRYCWLDTDGRGITISDAVRQAPNVGTPFDHVQDFYAGINWYLNGNDLKIQLGYEYSQFSGSMSDKKPTLPKLIQTMGMPRHMTWRATPRIVPSPPSTMMRSSSGSSYRGELCSAGITFTSWQQCLERSHLAMVMPSSSASLTLALVTIRILRYATVFISNFRNFQTSEIARNWGRTAAVATASGLQGTGLAQHSACAAAQTLKKDQAAILCT